MKILILSPFLPYPLDQGGKIRIFNIIKNISSSHRITVVALVDDRSKTDLIALQELCEEVIVVERPARLWPDRFAFFSGKAPYNVIRYRSNEMERALRELLLRKKFDLVQIEFSMMWQYAQLFKDIPVVLDAHNIEYRNVEEIRNARGSLLWRMMYHLEVQRLRRVEELAFSECDLCFAVSEKEQFEIANICRDGAKVVAAVNGVDPDRFAFRLKENPGKKILFLGGMDYLPNLDAATHFLTEIFPLVRRKEPDTKVLLVGRELGRLGELTQHPGVESHESVPEVLPWFYQADVLAVPLRQGAGTRIKVLEAMAAGLPIVSTSKGCEGIPVINDMHLLIGDTPSDFASAVEKLMGDFPLRRRLAINARTLVEGTYSWRSVADTMIRHYPTLGAT